MSSRDHPFNRSTKLLLPSKQQHIKKKNSESKVRGFNDFDFITKQYSEFKSNIGYPYGCPPSPTVVTDSDFTFSDDAAVIDRDGVYKPLKSENEEPFKNYLDDRVTGPFIFGIHTSSNNKYNLKLRNNVDTVLQSSTKYSQELNTANKVMFNDNCFKIEDDINIGKFGVKQRETIKRDKERKTTTVKCVLVGDGAVGKTNLICAYFQNRFINDHIPTASDIYNFEVKVNKIPVQITLCDTAGQDTLDPLRQLSYPDSDIFLLCFSVVKPETFKSIELKWVPKFKKSLESILLIGTQADLRTDFTILNKLTLQGTEPVSKKDALCLAQLIGAKYIETSSRFNHGVKDAFDTAIWDSLIQRKIPKSKPVWKKLLCLI